MNFIDLDYILDMPDCDYSNPNNEEFYNLKCEICEHKNTCPYNLEFEYNIEENPHRRKTYNLLKSLVV